MRTSYLILILLFCSVCAGQSVNQHPELVVQSGHHRGITSIAFTRDSKLVATGSLDKTIKIWDVATGFQIRTLSGHTKEVTSVAFSPDGHLLASGSFDYTARVWDVSTGELRFMVTHSLAVQSVAISPDGRILATAGLDRLIMLWDLATGQQIRKPLSGHGGNVSSIAFSPNGKILASSSWDKTVRLWDVSTGQLIEPPLQAGIALMSVAFSPNGRMVVSGGSFSIVKVWDVASGRELYTVNAGAERIVSLAFSPDGKFLASGSNNLEGQTVKVWDADTGREAEAFRTFLHKPRVSALAFSADNNTLAIGDEEQGVVSLVDTATTTERFVLKGHSAVVNSIAFTSDNKSLLVAAAEPVIKQWDLEQKTSEVVTNLVGLSGYATAIALSPEDKRLASGSPDGAIKLWDLANGTSRLLGRHKGIVNSVAFSPDGKLFASGSDDDTVILWNVQSGEMLLPLQGHDDSVNMVAFSPDGKMIASASSDTTIRLWNVSDGREISKITGHANEVECLGFSPDGRFLASGSVDMTIKLWRITTLGNDIQTSLVKTLTGHSSAVQSLAFSPDGNLLASGSWDRTVRLWDVASGKQTQTLGPHPGTVVSLAFGRTGKLLASASADSVKLWDTASCNELASLIALDQDDWGVITPEGRFDGSQNAQQLMRFVVGVKLAMDLDQLTKEHYEPGLLPKLLGFDKTPLLLKVKPFKEVNVDSPEVEVEEPTETGTVMTVKLKNEGGGFGPVRVIVNHSERLADARPPGFDPDKAEAKLTIDLKQFERFLLPGEDNPIEVEAYSKANVPSRKRTIVFKPSTDKPIGPQQLWAVVVGTGKYASAKVPTLTAGADARAIAKAFSVAGERLFPGQVHITTLSTDSEKPEEQPTKKNIVDALKKIRNDPKVAASDILLVYLAGHGVSYGGESGDYYYLTSEASTTYLGEGAERDKALAGKEIAYWLREIPTAKRVLILDTCAAGRISEDIQTRGVDGTNERAWAEMNNSTGLWLLAGSAADADSFEVGDFGMGLLTYSLLKGLKIDWTTVLVRDERSNLPELIDVDELFKYCKIVVNKLAHDSNRRQDPQKLSGPRRVFIGRITGADRPEIPLPLKRPVYVRSNFQLQQEPRDPLHLAALLDARLRTLSAAGMDATLFFTDARSDPGSYRLSGLYTIDGAKVQVNVYIYEIGQDGSDILLGTSFPIPGEAAKIDDLVETIIEGAVRRIPKPR
jgi:WD40 repeat protein